MSTATQTARISGTVLSPTAPVSQDLLADAAATDQDSPEESAAPINEISVFEGAQAVLSGDAKWQIQKPFTYLEMQREESPCEARQFFSAVCVEDPSKKHATGERAVIKIKFQVCATEEATDVYEDYVDEQRKDLNRHPDRADDLQAALAKSQKQLEHCTKPSRRPNRVTYNELMALYRLCEKKCSSAPRLLDVVRERMDKTLTKPHRRAVVGGFIVVMLMTKVQGRLLDPEYVRNLTPAERENLRQDFKAALIDVLKCAVVFKHKNSRKLQWDKEKRKCYIVDFEDSVVNPDIAKKELEYDDDKVFALWRLAEDHFRYPGCYL